MHRMSMNHKITRVWIIKITKILHVKPNILQQTHTSVYLWKWTLKYTNNSVQFYVFIVFPRCKQISRPKHFLRIQRRFRNKSKVASETNVRIKTNQCLPMRSGKLHILTRNVHLQRGMQADYNQNKQYNSINLCEITKTLIWVKLFYSTSVLSKC